MQVGRVECEDAARRDERQSWRCIDGYDTRSNLTLPTPEPDTSRTLPSAPMLRMPMLRASTLPQLRAPITYAASRLFSSSAAKPGFFELRTDRVQPGSLDTYLQEVQRTAAARTKFFPGWLGIWKVALGGDNTTVMHLYHWKDYDQRDAARAAVEDSIEWSDRKLESACAVRRNVAFVEAADTLRACGLPGALAYSPIISPNHDDVSVCGSKTRVTWELRTYQLRLGYDAVPTFLELYASGLEEKLAADASSGASSLCTLLYSDNVRQLLSTLRPHARPIHAARLVRCSRPSELCVAPSLHRPPCLRPFPAPSSMPCLLARSPGAPPCSAGPFERRPRAVAPRVDAALDRVAGRQPQGE